MNGMMKSISGLLCAAGLFATAAARADIPPPDVCQAENAVCHNAGENYDKDGVCTAAPNDSPASAVLNTLKPAYCRNANSQTRSAPM